MSKPLDLVSVLDIVHCATLIQRVVSQTSLSDVQQDERDQAAIERWLLQIGEAVTRLSHEFQVAHPDVPWKRLRNLRNLIVHRYEDVRVEEVWAFVNEELPPVATYLRDLVGHLPE